MKRLFLLVLCFCLFMSVPVASAGAGSAGGGSAGGTVVDVPESAVASGKAGDDCFWYIVGDTLTVTGRGDMTVNSYHSVPWAGYHKKIKTVIIEDGITKISDYCFVWHSALESVQLGKDVKVIGSNAFIGCDKLSHVNFPDGLKNIDYQAFSGCNMLSGVSLPDSVEKVGSEAFNYTADYENPENWSDGVFYLGTYAVSENYDIPEKVIIRDGTKKISDSINLSSAKVVVIPESVIGFGNYTFHDGIIVEGVLESGAEESARSHNLLFFEIGKPHIITESFGSGFSWTLDADKRWLTISGNGDTGNFGYSEAPWYRVFNYVDTVELKNGITALGRESLLYLDEIKLIVPDSVTEIRCDVYDKTVICGNKGSFAETFAKENGLLFETPDGNVSIGGNLNDKISWHFSKNEFSLTITGTGDMPDFESFYDAPWNNYGQFIDEIVISDGITGIGNNSFNCDSKQYAWIAIPDSVESISSSAFAGTKILYCPKGSYAAGWAEQNAKNYEIYDRYQEIRVETSDELLSAIGSNRKIVLADGFYLTNGTIIIEYARDLVIEAEHSGYVEILSTDGYRPVIEFFCCKGVTVSGVILGHRSLSYQQGACGGDLVSAGYVVECDHSSDISLASCDLYGCGTIAVMMCTAYGISLDDCILRDCKENVITNDGGYILDRRTYMDTYINIRLSDCVISGNAYDDEFAKNTPAIDMHQSVADFDNCIFVNNKSTKREISPQSTNFEDCIFKDNVWQNQTPLDYGICLGGITWKVTDGENGGYVLHLGFPLEYEDGTVIESAKGVTIPYSEYSIPWRKFENETFEAIRLADGVKLGGKCGEMVYWELSEEGVLTISGGGTMNFADSYAPWGNYYNHLIKGVVVQSGVETIAPSAFSSCMNLSAVTLSEGILEIGSYAFSSCWRINEINIPASVTAISGSAFNYCEGIKGFNVSENSESYTSKDGVLFTKDASVLVMYPSGKENESYDVPEGTAKIKASAFSSNDNLKILSLPSSLESLEPGAILWMHELESVSVDDGNNNFSADDGVLFNEQKTKLIYYPGGKQDISYVIPSGVKEIAESALRYSNNLLKIVLPDSIELIQDSNFESMYDSCVFVCKKGSYAYNLLLERHYRVKEKDDFMVASINGYKNISVHLPDNREVDGYVVIAAYDWHEKLSDFIRIKVEDESEIKAALKTMPANIKIMWLDMDGKLRPLSEYVGWN